jgi:hypothetical protein
MFNIILDWHTSRKKKVLKKKKELNKRLVIYQTNVQLFQKSAIIWVWGKLTQGVDGGLEKMNSSC